MKIVVLQPPYPASPEENAARSTIRWMLDRIATLAPEETDLVLLPEYANAPGLPPGPVSAEFARTDGAVFLDALRRAAARLESFVCTGVYAPAADGARSRAVLIAPDGTEIAVCDKIHITGAEREAGIRPGGTPGVVRTDHGTFGIAICFDVYFPEYVEALAALGARIILSPSYQRGETPERIRTMSACRALDSGAVFIRSAYAMPGGRTGGASLAAAPDGSIVADAGTAPGVIHAEVDPDRGFVKPASFGAAEIAHRELIEDARRPDFYRPAVEREKRLAGLRFPRLCAHRGLSSVCPENTLPAFTAAVAIPSVAEIEFDLWLSADDVPVVCHDPRVDRTTDGAGRIGDLSWAEIASLDAGAAYGDAWRGVRVPRLEETLDVLGHHVVLNIHVKEPGSGGRLLEILADELRARGLVRSAYVAGDAPVLDAIRRIAPEIPRCCLEAQGVPEKQIEAAREFGCTRIQFGRNAGVEHIRAACEQGFVCNLFWSDEPDDARVQIANGYDVLLTNCAHVLDAAGVAPQS